MSDYENRREAAAEAVKSIGMKPILAEEMSVASGTPREVILDDAIADCDALIGIYGSSYGWTGAKSGKSPTEEEFDRARELGKPIYAFIDRIEDTPIDSRQLSFLERVQNWDVGVLRREFRSLHELHTLVREALTGPDSSPLFRRFLKAFITQAQNINGLRFREESQPFVPGVHLVLHSPSNQFSAGVDSYILVIDGDTSNRKEVDQVIQNWCAEVDRSIGAGFWKARGASSAILIVVEKNPFGFSQKNISRNRGIFKKCNYDEMMVNLISKDVVLPSGHKPWINPLKKAVESVLK